MRAPTPTSYVPRPSTWRLVLWVAARIARTPSREIRARARQRDCIAAVLLEHAKPTRPPIPR